ncbi:Gene D protein; GpD [Erwinia pyrifoliae DSM 12163]|nr:Gene D protein; GpD [Erwinia pyrifoliae DSM 12163]
MAAASARCGGILNHPDTRPRRTVPGLHLTISGFKDEIDSQDWIIARAEHTIDDNGFTTRLELEAKIPDWIAETE